LHTRILIPAASGPDDGKPNLVRYAKPIHGLQDEFKGKRQFELGDDDQGWFARPKGDDVTAVDFAFPVRLDEGFYQSLIEHPLPLREAAIRQISSRSLALDLYVWLAYRLHVLTGPVKVNWAALKSQFGAEYKELRFFRRDLMPPLKIALSVYPEAQIKIDDKHGITLYPSAPPVPERRLLAL
jgi:hypothetical protein